MNVYEIFILYFALLNLFVATAYIFDDQIRDFVSRVCAIIDSIKRIWRKEPEPKKPLEDFVGKSHFKMPHVIAAEQEQKRKEILASGKSIEDEDVVFESAPSFGTKRKFEQVPDEKLDEIFSNTKMEDVARYSEEEKAPSIADGNTFEEIAKAVDTACEECPSTKDVRQAGKVFVELDGNELFERLANRTPEIKKRIKLLMELYVTEDSKTKETAPKSSPAKNRTFVPVPDNIEDFDIRNYV